jgi:hypothetical protein
VLLFVQTAINSENPSISLECTAMHSPPLNAQQSHSSITTCNMTGKTSEHTKLGEVKFDQEQTEVTPHYILNSVNVHPGNTFQE